MPCVRCRHKRHAPSQENNTHHKMWRHAVLCSLLLMLSAHTDAKLVSFTPTSAFPNRCALLRVAHVRARHFFLFSKNNWTTRETHFPPFTPTPLLRDPIPLSTLTPPTLSTRTNVRQVRAERVFAGGVQLE